MKFTLEKIDDEKIGLRFPYDKFLVEQLRGLQNRKWNARQNRWEVHLAHLADVMRIFQLHPREVPAELLELYRANWIQSNIRVRVTHHSVYLTGAKIPVGRIDQISSLYLPGYQFSPKYISRRWDGKRHLFQRSGNSAPAGLLGPILRILEEEQLEYELEDERKWPRPRLKIAGDPAGLLRPYQRAALEAALERRRGILQIPTGGGKTLLAAALLARLRRPALFLAHTRDLLLQARGALEQLLQCPVGQLGDGVLDVRAINVATIQTLARALAAARELPAGAAADEAPDDDQTDVAARAEELANLLETVPVVIFDECHHLPANTFYGIAQQALAAGWRYGLSATPYREDEQDLLLEAAIGPKIFEVNASTLIDDGYLLAPRIVMLKAEKLELHKRYRDYRDVYKHYVVENVARNKLIAETALKLADSGHSALILVTQIQHGKNLLRLIPGAEFIQGADAAALRAELLADLRSKRLRLLIATTLADEGLDIPSLDAVILAGAGKSVTRAFQRIGRALRPFDGKTRAIIVDFFDQAPFLQEHSLRRLQLYRTEPRFKIETRGFSVD